MEEQKIPKKKGGYRPGAGRKKGASAVIMERSRAYALQKMEEHLEPIIQTQINLAKGIWVESSDGKTIYQKEPDIQALKHLVDQLIGKAKESVDLNHSGK